jgi:hypothetical protein
VDKTRLLYLEIKILRGFATVVLEGGRFLYRRHGDDERVVWIGLLGQLKCNGRI